MFEAVSKVLNEVFLWFWGTWVCTVLVQLLMCCVFLTGVVLEGEWRGEVVYFLRNHAEHWLSFAKTRILLNCFDLCSVRCGRRWSVHAAMEAMCGAFGGCSLRRGESFLLSAGSHGTSMFFLVAFGILFALKFTWVLVFFFGSCKLRLIRDWTRSWTSKFLISISRPRFCVVLFTFSCW